MSLIHWWPLNGDTLDYIGGKNGVLLGDANVTTIGKTGKCLSGMNEAQTIAGVSVPNCNLIDELTSNYSFACWFKVHGTHVHYNGTIMSSGNWNKQAWAVGVDQSNSKIDVFDNKYNHWVNIGYTLTNEKWYHLVSVFQNGTSFIYLNGEFIGQRASDPVQYSDATNLTIGRETYAAGYFSFNGDICDVRIYNHALSPKEVYDLSKAMVYHYSFNDALPEETPELALPEKISWSKLTLAIASTRQGNHFTITSSTDNTPSANVGSLRLNIPSGVLVTGKYYDFSCKYRILSDSGSFTISDWCDTQIKLIEKQTEDYCELIANHCYSRKGHDDIDPTSPYHFMDFKMSTNSTVEVWDITLREVSAKFPHTDIAGQSYISNEAGLGIAETKALTPTVDTASGLYAVKFDPNQPSYIKMPCDLSGQSEVSFACWVCANGGTCITGHALYTILSWSNGLGQISLYAYGRANSWLYSVGAPLKQNEWTHVAVTYSDKKRALYINGKKNAEGDVDGTFEARSTLDFGADSSTVRVFDGKMSDIRVYRSCLTEEDVWNLYQTKAYIDNHNQFCANMIVENQTAAEVTNKYMLNTSEIYEDLDEYESLEYLESVGAQYIDTGYVAKTDSVTYEIDFESEKTADFDTFIGFMNPSNNAVRAGVHYYSGAIMFGANDTVKSGVAPTANERMVLKGDFTNGAQKLYKNDELIASSAKTFNFGNNELSTYIFARNCTGSMNYSNIKLYSAKIYEGKTLVRYYIPMKRKSDKVSGLYDLMTKTFVTNGGSGDFNIGTIFAHENASIYNGAQVSARNFVEV